MQELWFLRSACRLMLIDIYMKFREDSLNGFQVIKLTRFCDSPREITQKVLMQELIYSGVILELSEREKFCDSFREKFWSKFWISLYTLYIFTSLSSK